MQSYISLTAGFRPGRLLVVASYRTIGTTMREGLVLYTLRADSP